LLLAGFIEFLAGFIIKLSQTILLPIRSLLLADCDDTGCRATSRLLALFSGSFCCCFYYDIYCCSHLRHNNRYQLIGRVRSRRHRHPVIMPVHLQSSDVSTCGHFSASTTTSSSCVATRRIDLLCLTETWHDADSAILGRLRRAGYNVVDRPRPRAADDDLSVNHGGVHVMSAADVSLSPIAVTQPTSFQLVCAQAAIGSSFVIVVVL